MKSNSIVRGLTETYYDIQANRIAVGGQIRAFRDGVSEQEKVFVKTKVFDSLHGIEKDIVRYLNEWLVGVPVYTQWLTNLKGIGPILSAGLIAWIGDIGNFATISKLWAYCGLSAGHVKLECKKGHKLIATSYRATCPVFANQQGKLCGADMKLLEKVEGRPPKREKGWALLENRRLKTHAWKIGESFVKTKGGYRNLYNKFRAEYDEKWVTPEDCGSKGCANQGKGKCMDGHRFAAAKRKTVKVFLAHLWMKWRELEGLPGGTPFIIGKTDAKGVEHTHEIPIVME